MTPKQRSRRNFWQNILITLLSFSAVVLFILTQINNRNLTFSSLATGPVDSGSHNSESSSFAVPVRVAVSGSYGRYGSVTLSTATASEEFAPLGAFLGEVLGSAESYTVCSISQFFSSLEGSSVYYDFLAPLPLSILGGLVGAEGDDAVSVRYLVVTAEEEQVLLYLWDGDALYLTGATALSAGDLDSLIVSYEQGNAFFALDGIEEYADYTPSLHPLSLFLPDMDLALPLLTAGNSFADSDTLLSSLAFNPYTQTRWTESNGTEVILDGDRTLRLRSDGSLSYRSGGSDALTVGSGETPTLWEAATETETLLNRFLPEGTEARLYLTGISRSGEMLSLTYSYHYNGIPIRFADGSSAAKVTLSGNVVTSLVMTCREYHTGENTAMLLPLRQALAIAAQKPGAELLIGYADFGEHQVSPQWLCE